jgi:aldehyde dehydrogenase (NAD+)
VTRAGLSADPCSIQTPSERGWFIEPAVFGNVDNGSTINASVFTNDLERARRVAGGLRSGTVGHNAFRTDFGIAFGGIK